MESLNRGEDLSREFFKVVDLTQIESQLLSRSQTQPWTKIGEGFHFTSYLMPSQDSTGLGIVCSVSRKGFLSDLDSLKDKWRLAIQELSKMRHPLIPPMLVFNLDEQIVYLKPYCPQKLSIEDIKQPDIQELLSSLHEQLRQHRLVLEDYPQIFALDGHPYIVDWSDLRWL